MDGEPSESARTHHVRETIAAILVVLSCLTFTIATPAVWAHRNFLDTDRFVDRVGPLVDDPAVQTALVDKLTEQVMLVVKPERLFQEVLPERGQILAAPLASALRNFVHDKVEQFITSDTFSQLWKAAIREAHSQAVGILRGDSKVTVVRNGIVTLDLVPIINGILDAINRTTPDVLGRDVQIPLVNAGDDPDSAVNKIAAALHVQLPENFGRMEVYSRNQLSSAQEAVHLFDRFVVVSVVLAILFAAGALLLTYRRRRAVAELAVGVLLGMVLLRRIAFRLVEQVTAIPPKTEGRAAARVILTTFTDPLTTFAAWSAAVALVVLFVSWITSSQSWAVAVRRKARTLGESTWVHEHPDLVRAAGPIVGVLVLWFANLGWLGVLAVIVLTLLYELGARQLLARTATGTT